MSGKPLSKSAKQMIVKLCAFCELEKVEKNLIVPLEKVQDRVSVALGVSTSTVTSVIKEAKTGTIRSPKKKRKKKKPVTDLDELHQSAIRRCIYSSYKEGKNMTVKKLLAILKAKDLFHGSRTSLLTVMHKLEFTWKQANNRRFLVEKNEIAISRFSFLKKYIENKNSEHPLPVIYMGETWIFEKGAPTKTRQEEAKSSVKKPKENGGKRYNVVHAGSKGGFVAEAKLIFASRQNIGDYHADMDSANYIKWLQNQLLPVLEEPSLIIVDNTPYNSALLERIPNFSWSKKEIKEWLRKKNISFESTDFKFDLLSLVKSNEPQQVYAVDNMIHEAGHSVLRLPPFHCQYNAIEMVWGIAKTFYNGNVSSTKNNTHEEVMRVWQEAVDHITPDIWTYCVQHTEEIIDKAWDDELKFDFEDSEPFAIGVDSDPSDTSDSSADSD